jgi:hypothetical protein
LSRRGSHIDIARVDQLRRHLRENPKYHRQLEFACGTTACAAGWAVALEHSAQVGNKLEQIIEQATAHALTPGLEDEWRFPWLDLHTVYKDDYCPDIATYARMLLDFSADEARTVFFSTLGASDPEADTVALLDALVHREKGELTEEDIVILEKYELPLETTTSSPESSGSEQ